uniref:Uncharacterized protein n=1 Tax=Panagrolaimus davidi TaxID=227884 RepID=A0A914QRD5_9BILA
MPPLYSIIKQGNERKVMSAGHDYLSKCNLFYSKKYYEIVINCKNSHGYIVKSNKKGTQKFKPAGEIDAKDIESEIQRLVFSLKTAISKPGADVDRFERMKQEMEKLINTGVNADSDLTIDLLNDTTEQLALLDIKDLPEKTQTAVATSSVDDSAADGSIICLSDSSDAGKNKSDISNARSIVVPSAPVENIEKNLAKEEIQGSDTKEKEDDSIATNPPELIELRLMDGKKLDRRFLKKPMKVLVNSLENRILEEREMPDFGDDEYPIMDDLKNYFDVDCSVKPAFEKYCKEKKIRPSCSHLVNFLLQTFFLSKPNQKGGSDKSSGGSSKSKSKGKKNGK